MYLAAFPICYIPVSWSWGYISYCTPKTTPLTNSFPHSSIQQSILRVHTVPSTVPGIGLEHRTRQDPALPGVDKEKYGNNLRNHEAHEGNKTGKQKKRVEPHGVTMGNGTAQTGGGTEEVSPQRWCLSEGEQCQAESSTHKDQASVRLLSLLPGPSMYFLVKSSFTRTPTLNDCLVSSSSCIPPAGVCSPWPVFRESLAGTV